MPSNFQSHLIYNNLLLFYKMSSFRMSKILFIELTFMTKGNGKLETFMPRKGLDFIFEYLSEQ